LLGGLGVDVLFGGVWGGGVFSVGMGGFGFVFCSLRRIGGLRLKEELGEYQFFPHFGEGCLQRRSVVTPPNR